MKGFIYDCTNARQADRYAKTTREITEYVGRTYKFGMDARLAIENLDIVKAEMPEDPAVNSTRTEIRIWEKHVDNYVKRDTFLRENMKTAHSLIWGQCSDMMRQRLEVYEDFTRISSNGNSIEFLKLIKNTTYN